MNAQRVVYTMVHPVPGVPRLRLCEECERMVETFQWQEGTRLESYYVAHVPGANARPLAFCATYWRPVPAKLDVEVTS